jgi:hypothetical protein
MTEFVFDMPLWIMVDPVELRKTNLTRAMKLATYDDKGTVFPVFTDDDLAERFARDSGINGAVPHKVQDAARLIPLVSEALHVGVKIAALDIAIKPARHRTLMPIGEFLARLEALSGETG